MTSSPASSERLSGLSKVTHTRRLRSQASFSWTSCKRCPPLDATSRIGRCPVTALVRATLADQARDRLEHELHVAPRRPVRHVQTVQLRHLVERDVARSEDLPEAGHAGLQVEA